MNQGNQPSPDAVRLWDRIAIVLEKAGKKSEFLARIENIDVDHYTLEMPIRQSGELHLAKGDFVDVTYNRPDAVYSFKASILDLFEGEARSVRIKRESDSERIQRRRYVRLDISEKMRYRVLDIPGSKRNCLGAECQGTLLNISAGGVLFESGTKFKPGSILALSFALKGEHALNNILSVAKRCEGSRASGFLTGAEFMTKANCAEYGLKRIEEFLPPGAGTFDENLQKLIVQFIYRQQVELKRKGLVRK